MKHLLVCLLAVFLASCLTPASPDLVRNNMNLVREADESRQNIQTLLGALAWYPVSDKDKEKIREYRDVEYIYYHAAAIALAAGDLDGYKAYMELSRAELAAWTEYIKELIASKYKTQ